MHNRNEKKYNEVIGIKPGDVIVVLDDIFRYDDGMCGATYYSMEPLTKTDIEAQNDPGNLKDLWQEAVAGGVTEQSLQEWAEEVRATMDEDLYFPYDDPSFRSQIREAIAKLPPEQAQKIAEIEGRDEFVDWNVFGCGRLGRVNPDEFETVLNPQLIKDVNEVEGE